jgi:hypothetical protein
LIDKLEEDEEDDISGLLLLIDFEKAFDTVEWSFIEKTLQFYGFGPSLEKCIRAFYCDISSAVTKNGHVSEFFSLDNPKSLDQSLSMFNKFSDCAGLRVNFDKTEAIWLGSRRSCHEQLLPDKHLSWNFSGKF